jgi:membrane-associated phospholipid phosphatase
VEQKKRLSEKLKMLKSLIVAILCFITITIHAVEETGPKAETKAQSIQSGTYPWGKSYWQDFKLAFIDWPLKGFVEQFRTKSNLYIMGAAVPTLWYSFKHDDRLSALGRATEMPSFIDNVGDSGVIFNFPVIPIAFYALSLKTKNSHHAQFAAEYAASLYLALGESALMSFIPVHDRPDREGLNFFETAFRGRSSFPSGHVMPYAVLTFKAFQFYGPWWAIPPLALTVMSSLQRVVDGRHFVSDVVGGVFLAAFASEGVRQMAGYQKNDPVYKWVFEHDAHLGIIRHEGVVGPKVAWSF